MSQVFPMPPVKLLGIPRKPHMNMPCRIRGFNRILERCSYGPPLSSGFVGQILGLPHWGPTGNESSDRLHLKNDGWNTFSLPFGALNFPIFRGKLAELVSGSKRMTWAP